LLVHVPVLLHDSGCSPLHSSWPGAQLPSHWPLTHVWFVHAAALPHCPFEPHVCTPLLVVEHCRLPGVHRPVHPPFTHAWLLHATAPPHCPFEPQVCTPLPEHCVAFGLHATHAPLRQTGVAPLHVEGLPHWPFEPQVSTPLPAPPSLPPAHSVAPGVHTPVHAPPLHTYVHGTGLPHEPPEQVSTPLPEHCVALVVHEPLHVPLLLQTYSQALPVFCQVPVSSHVCGCRPLHWVEPGVHEPLHAPPLHTYGHVVPVFVHAPDELHV
jgi:hypothetical protein